MSNQRIAIISVITSVVIAAATVVIMATDVFDFLRNSPNKPLPQNCVKREFEPLCPDVD